LPPDSEMSTACTPRATLSSTLSCSPSTKISKWSPIQILPILILPSVKEKIGGSDPTPVFLVFHGGSGSTKKEARIFAAYFNVLN